MPAAIQPSDLVVHVMNVGFGDAILLELPTTADGENLLGIVDCYKGAKMLDYIKALQLVRSFDGVAFICATHPHLDHVAGIRTLLEDPLTRPREFWDSGFRHKTTTYLNILETIHREKIPMRRISSGMEFYYGTLRITALGPSVALRNRYATYGIDMNNASIVLRLENCADDVVVVESLRYRDREDPEILRDAGDSVVILGADAEFDNWAQIAEEYPHVERTSKHDPLVKKVVNLLNCSVLKVSHHGSMHSAPLDVYERMSPALAILSSKQEVSSVTHGALSLTRTLYPHPVAVETLRESGSDVLSTDGFYEGLVGGANSHPGTIVVVVAPGMQPRYTKLSDDTDSVPAPPVSVSA
jgi:beta-lactamase superfamily II metal-dependent hydrolase